MNHQADHQTFRQIDQDVQSGKLSLEDGMLNKFYHVYEPGKLRQEYKDERGFVKCLTPLMIEYHQNKDQLSTLSKSNIESYLTNTTVTDTLISPSGKFRLMYTTSGEDSVSITDSVAIIDSAGNGIPDYIEKAALYADSSWTHQVNSLGFREFVLNDEPYSISFKNISGGYYGMLFIQDGTTYIEVNSSFKGFPPNNDPEGHELGALKVTIAHEIKHAIQYATNQLKGDGNNWAEMDATLMEEIVFPKVDDYYNYIKKDESVFNSPQTSIPGSYPHITWALYFAERFDMQFWVEVWEKIGENHFKPMMEAIDETLSEREHDLSEEFIRNYMWHYASGPNSQLGYGFEDRWVYPEAFVTANSDTIPATLGDLDKTNHQAARFYQIKPGLEDVDSVLVALFHDNPNMGLGLLAYNKDRTLTELITYANGTDPMLIKTDWIWEDLDKLVIVAVNMGSIGTSQTRWLAGSGRGIEKMLYGNVLHTGTLTDNDAEELLRKSLVQNDSYFQATQLVADVSGNNSITAYDAALVLRSLADEDYRFPIDYNESKAGPEYESFVSFSEPAPLAKYTVMVEDSASFTMETLTEDVTVNNDLDIAINLSETDLMFSSAFLEINYSDHLRFDKVVLEDTQNRSAFWKFVDDTTHNLLKIALAQDDYFYAGRILTLRFEPLVKDSFVYTGFNMAQLDEQSLGFRFADSEQMKVGHKVIVTTPEDELPLVVDLKQNYPNPFNPSTKIEFALPQTSPVSLIVYDVTGREVAKLADEVLHAGSHNYVFYTSGLASGMYIYRLQTPDRVLTKKMMFLK
ncbi:MAG: T9SS type A sorting domain-containing protein [Balneolales bacterium]